MQVFTALCLISAIISPSVVWNALTNPGGGPALALTFAILIAGSNQGTMTLNGIFLIIATAIGGLFAAAISYITFAANGNSYEDTVTKGIVFTLLFSATAGILNALRWRNDVTNMFYLLLVVTMVFAGGLSTYHAASVDWKAALYTLIYACIPAAAMTFSSWFILPVTAGSQYRGLMGKALTSTASALGSIEGTMLAPLNANTGRLADATGQFDPSNGSDMGLAEHVAGMNGHLKAARGALMASGQLHVPVILEVDIYNSPRIFPRADFSHAKLCAWVVINAMPIIARSLNTGHLKLSLLQRSPLKERFQDMIGSMQRVLNTLADTIVAQKDFRRADDELSLLDAAWMALLDDSKLVLEGCDDKDETSAVRHLSSLLYIAGSNIRTIYVAVPALVHVGDPDALGIAERRMQACPGWIKPSQAILIPHFESYAVLEKMQQEAELVTNATKVPLPRHEVKKEEKKASRSKSSAGASKSMKQPGVVHVMQSWRGSSLRAVQNLWHLPAWVVFGIQYAVVMAIAVGMSVVPVIAKEAFSGRPTVVVITVAVVWRPSIAGVHLRSMNRLLGTILAIIWSYFLLGVSYLVNGLSWDDTAGKWIAGFLLLAVWGAFCVANSVRYPSLAYMWLVAGFSVPLVTIASMRNNQSPLDDVIYRFFNVAIGICLVWVVSATFLPISARRILKANFFSTLGDLKTYIRLLPSHISSDGGIEKKDSLDIAVPATTPRDLPYSCTITTYHAIFSPKNHAYISLSLKIQKGLGYLLVTVPFLAADCHPCINLHRVSASEVLAAASSIQDLRDIMSFGFTLSRMTTENEGWHIPPVHYRFLTVVLGLTADAIDTLQQVLKKEVGMESALRTIKLLDTCVDELVMETFEAIEDEAESDGESEGGIENRARLPAKLALPVSLLLLLSINASEQVKMLYCATMKCFREGDPEALALADAVEDLITNAGSKEKAKKLVSRVMAKNTNKNKASVPQVLIHNAP